MAALAAAFEIRRVVEFGCGPFSTAAFLQRSVFNLVEEVVSYETDPYWADRTRATLADRRLTLHCVEPSMAQHVPRNGFPGVDLVFIDDSTSAVERTKTIAAVVAAAPRPRFIVTHDSEIPSYREALQGAGHTVVFSRACPFTAVTVQGKGGERRRLLKLRRSLNRAPDCLPIDDLQQWYQYFSSQ